MSKKKKKKKQKADNSEQAVLTDIAKKIDINMAFAPWSEHMPA